MATRRPRRIEDEIQQRRPFATPEQACLVGLLRTSDVIRRRLTSVIEPHGVTAQQYNVLRILRGAGSAGLPTLDIAERMIEHAPGITRLLGRLERKELVSRARSGSDQRRVVCRITSQGQALLARLDAPVETADRSCLGELDPDEVQRLIELLDAVRAAPESRAAAHS